VRVDGPDGLYVDDLPSDAGDGAPVVVLVHGSMDRHTSFARLRSRLMATCHVISYDRRGYAASRGAEPPAGGIDDHVRDLEAIAAGRRCTIVGHSYGGNVVLALAARRPDLVGSAVVYEPPLAWRPEWPHHGSQPPAFRGVSGEEAAEAFLRRMIGDNRYERLPLKTREEVLKDGDALVAELTAIRLDEAPYDPALIEVPVLVALGGDSDDRHRNASTWLAAELPHGSLHTIAGARHGGHQSHPAELATLVEVAVRLADDGEAVRPPALL
jgi:pimeloyl-ACP methyl ester carboxylesterase